MEIEELKQLAFEFIAENDEYADIIPDGNINEAAQLIADFVHNLWERDIFYEPDINQNSIDHEFLCKNEG